MILYSEALSSPAQKEWMIAMSDELNSMAVNQVSELVDLPMIVNPW